MLKLKAINSGFSKVRVAALSCLFSVFTVQSAMAAPIEISEVPAFLGGTVAPNIMFVLDDSGSMAWGYMPDDLKGSMTRDDCDYLRRSGDNYFYDCGLSTHRYLFSSALNNAYYNPNVTYVAPPGLPDSVFTNARSDGYDSGSTRVDLSSQFRPEMHRDAYTNGRMDYFYAGPARAAFYYTPTANCTNLRQDSCYPNSNRTDVGASERQNFANWYSYYRTRLMASKAGIARAFDTQSEGIRVGYGSLNKGSSSVDGRNTPTIVRGVRSFADDDRDDFFDWLYGVEADGPTPLKRALDDAGQYYSRTDSRGPWSSSPGVSSDAEEMLECRQSFTILMTDGYYNTGGDNEPTTSAVTANIDNQNGPFHSGPGRTALRYEALDPFKDSNSGTLADIANYYWKNDLHSGLANNVPIGTSAINPAFWQHMVTFGVGLGVTGSVDADDAFGAIANNDTIPWGDISTNPGKIDDLLHAAVNSRGGFFSAADPDTFSEELSDVLFQIVNRVEESATAAAASSAVLRQDSLAFSAGYRSTDWSGALQATEILRGGARGQLIWDAEYELEDKGASARDLFTTAGNQAVELKFLNSLSEDQRDALNTAPSGTLDNLGQSRIDWLRGASPANFRSRSFQPDPVTPSRLRLLGDIIGSNPQFAGPVNYGYRRLPGTEGSSYGTYRSSAGYLSRPNVVYVGANDGFLHAFDSLTGEELFGYMPSELLKPGSNDSARINFLMDEEYTHRFYMNGTPTISDAYIDGSWRTVLVGAMGVGGRTVFALDISDPENFSASDVLWEFTDPDLGRGVDSPQIVRLPSGEWAAVFGNGYNSDSNESGMFVVDLEDGSLIQKVMTGIGSAAAPNGMATPVVLLDQATGIATRAYAGDLRGNVWRVNLSNFNDAKLFTATSPNGAAQPITVAPQIAEKPNGDPGELVVVFGTGSYFRVLDSEDTQIQSLYGIYDDGSNANLARRDLLEQEITSQRSSNFDVESEGVTTTEALDIRVVSDKAPGTGDDGWLLDLDTSGGERVISRAAFPSGFPVKRVRFSTLIPDNNVCGGGREGYLMDIDLLSGGQTDDAVFDLNKDGSFDTGDAAGSDIVNGIRGVVSGEQIQVVLDNTTDLFIDSVIVDLPPDYTGPRQPDQPGQGDDDSDGGTGDLDEPPCTGPLCGAAEGYNFGRQNWEELR